MRSESSLGVHDMWQDFKCRFWASLNLTAYFDYTALSGRLTSANYLEAALDINGAEFWAPYFKYQCSFTFCTQTKSTVLVNTILVMSPLHIPLYRIIIMFMYNSMQFNNCYLYIMFWIHKEMAHKSQMFGDYNKLLMLFVFDSLKK